MQMSAYSTGTNVDTSIPSSGITSKMNTAVLRSAPGAYKYRVFAVTLEASQDIKTNEHLCYQANIQDTHIISDDKEELSNEHEQSQDIFRPHEPDPNGVHVIDDTDERLLAADNPQVELLWWHYLLRHISFARLCILTLLGTIPRKLVHRKTPKCAGCIY
jgi:hypothetical protein